MRLWSLHPGYLDAKGLVALWREALLARAVLRGQTRAYRHHPQLERFLRHHAPLSAINAYLRAVHAEASVRGYDFDKRKIGPVRKCRRLAVTSAQLEHEWNHLLAKLRARTPELHERWRRVAAPHCHPMFYIRPGSVAPWERRPKLRRRRKFDKNVPPRSS